MSPAARLALAAIRAYRLLFSPYFRGSCRFSPSCSQYASEAIATHGILRGGWIAASRLARCHPLGTPGYDPVPPASRATPAPLDGSGRERHAQRELTV